MSLSISRLYHVSILLASMEEYNPAATTITIKGVSATRSFLRNFRLANRPMWNALPGAYGGHDLRLTSLVQDIRLGKMRCQSRVTSSTMLYAHDLHTTPVFVPGNTPFVAYYQQSRSRPNRPI